MSKTGVLVVDDDADCREFVGNVLQREGVRAVLAGSGRQALTLLERDPAEVLFVELAMPDMDGLELLRRVRRVRPQASTVAVVVHARVGSCIEALRLGVCDYVTKPYTAQAVRAALGLALERRRCAGCCAAARSQVPVASFPARGEGAADEPLVARSEAMRRVCDLVAKIAPTMAAVLIRGEPGAGKATVARAIHRKSRHASGPFFQVNCKAIREADLPVRLFCDYCRASGANQWEAQGGTVFFSQVDHLPLWAQLQLLEVLKTGCVHRCSTPRPAPMDLRLIASTSEDLEAALTEGRFSPALYYYLNVITVHVPPLRQRPQDFDLLAQRCLEQTVARQDAGKGPTWSFAPEARQCLRSYGWPGNLPELASVVERAVAMSDGPQIGKDAVDFAPPAAPDGRRGTLPVPMLGNFRQIERKIVEEVIQRSGGNKAAAARVLGLHRRTLYRILEEQGPAEK